MKFCFGDIVVVDTNQIGVIVKSYTNKTYEIYVRSYSSIKTYDENNIQRYMVRHKYLDENELEWQYNALNNL